MGGVGWRSRHRLHDCRYEAFGGRRDDGIAVTAQSSHAGGSPMSQRECAGFNWPPPSIPAVEPISRCPRCRSSGRAETDFRRAAHVRDEGFRPLAAARRCRGHPAGWVQGRGVQVRGWGEADRRRCEGAPSRPRLSLHIQVRQADAHAVAGLLHRLALALQERLRRSVRVVRQGRSPARTVRDQPQRHLNLATVRRLPLRCRARWERLSARGSRGRRPTALQPTTTAVGYAARRSPQRRYRPPRRRSPLLPGQRVQGRATRGRPLTQPARQGRGQGGTAR
jgi:hypothetical protein